MSQLETLKTQRVNLIIQRSQARDVIEQTERALGIVQGQIAVLEAAEAEQPDKE